MDERQLIHSSSLDRRVDRVDKARMRCIDIGMLNYYLSRIHMKYFRLIVLFHVTCFDFCQKVLSDSLKIFNSDREGGVID